MSETVSEGDSLEKGVPVAKAEGPPVKKPAVTSQPSGRGQYIARVVLALFALLFVVLVPTLVVVSKNKDSQDSSSIKDEVGAGGTNTTVTICDAGSPEGLVFVLDEHFNSSLPVFSIDITDGYSDEAELRKDIANAARFFLNNVIKRNLNEPGFESAGRGNRHPNSRRVRRGRGAYGYTGAPGDGARIAYEEPDFAPAPVSAPGYGGDAASGSVPASPIGDDVDDFGTNNQEEDVEEGDLIVSDGELVYAAYGDHIVIWTASTGEMVAQLQMPLVESLEGGGSGGYGYYRYYGYDDRAFYGDIARRPAFRPKPRIQSLTLQQDRLLVIVSGYGDSIAASTVVDRDYPILHDYQATHIRLYNTAPLKDKTADSLELIGTSDLNGRFIGVRSINGVARVSTLTSIDTYSDLVAPLDRSLFRNLSDEEYTAAAVSLAEAFYIPSFVDALVAELTQGVTEVPDLARISLWTTELSPDGVVEQLSFSEGAVNTAAQVFSIDLNDNSNPLTISASGAFMPSTSGEVYATKETFIIAGEGWSYSAATGRSLDMTYLLGLVIDGALTSPASVGSVPGNILNSYSIDVVGNILRIATTVRNFRFVAEPIDVESEVLDEEPWDSNTHNFVIVLEMPGEICGNVGVMRERGRVRLGKPNEVFTAVRFFDNIAYAVTFERRDPFYALDLSDPDNPVVLGELDITGFSNYLYPINEDNTLILAVGEEADDQGISLGLQITIFDARDPVNLVAIQRHVIEGDRNTRSSSEAQWEFKSFRYIADHLIIPVSVYSWENYEVNFDGFVVFLATEDIIEESCRISHVDFIINNEKNVCYPCDASLPARSMIFGGNLMTTHKHQVVSTDLDTCTNVWSLDVVLPADSMDGCCGPW